MLFYISECLILRLIFIVSNIYEHILKLLIIAFPSNIDNLEKSEVLKGDIVHFWTT